MSRSIGEGETSPFLRRVDRELSGFTGEVSVVLRHWLELYTRAEGIPDRRDVSPDAMKSALSKVWLCDFVPAEDRFRYRLAGENVIASFGTAIRGRHLDELTDAAAYPRVHAYFKKCVEAPGVLLITGRIYAEQSRVAMGQRLMLPYGDGSGAVTGILGVTLRVWHDRAITGHTDPSHELRRHVFIRIADGKVEREDFRLS